MAKESISSKEKQRQEAKSDERCIPFDEAYEIYHTAQKLRHLFDAINSVNGYWGLLSARRMCELVLADTIKNLNRSIDSLKKTFPELEIPDYEDPIEVPYLAIN
ncbi:MAG: hypothetical protein JSV31_10525 [Desulfobacterales bacterium]|nr:MAG: hypothetical protein JSV31_10525 [Desulfobacterales bacterium]